MLSGAQAGHINETSQHSEKGLGVLHEILCNLPFFKTYQTELGQRPQAMNL